MESGFIVINKDKGIGSTKAVSAIKRLLRPKKIGHAGTLDPLAEGVLVIAVNEATKLVRFVEDGIKEYEFDIKWGEETDSGDLEGKVINTSSYRPSYKELQDVLPKFTGKIKQYPPIYSAVKIDGKRAYDLARNNIDFEMKQREVIIESLEIMSHESTFSRLKVICHKGTYVRSLARDIARNIETCGVVSYLRRNRVGKFLLSDAILLSKIENIEHNLKGLMKPMATLLDDILAFAVSTSQAEDLKAGRKIRFLTGFSFEEPEKEVVITSEGKIVCIAQVKGDLISPRRVIFDE